MIIMTKRWCIPKLKNGENLDISEAVASEQFTRPPARFAEASLVKKMEELGIGRPSTYASTITTIQKRGYVENENKDGEERVSKLITLKQGNIQNQKKHLLLAQKKRNFFQQILVF